MIINHEHPLYKHRSELVGNGKFNGAYYYSKEICKNIIPNVITDRSWVTIHVPNQCCNGAIVFIHSNVNLEQYDWLKNYDDLILVSSIEPTRKYMERFGKSILLPLSIDVDYVSQFRCPKTEKACYAGNRWKFKEKDLAKYVPRDVHSFLPMPRDRLLSMIAKYKEVYAVGRTAIEAKCLGAEIKVCDSRFPNPDIWQVLDNKDAAKMLQDLL